MSGSSKRLHPDLGPSSISRRDFLNGVLVASGAAAVSQSSPLGLLAEESSGAPCDGLIDSDPRALRGGNLASAFKVAHWMRDRRLSFERGAVVLAAGCDTLQGRFPISETTDKFDTIIVGGGIAGLSAAFYLLRRRPQTRILLLEANSYAGGNSGRDDLPPLPVAATTATAYCYSPDTAILRELHGAMNIKWDEHKIPGPQDCYYFDEYAPHVRPGHRGWNIETFLSGLKTAPYESQIVRDLLRSKDDFVRWENKDVTIRDPADDSPAKYDYLSEFSLEHYLTNVLHLHPAVSEFHSVCLIDILGGSAQHVNAHSAISFLATEFSNNVVAFPGGNSEVARRLSNWLSRPGDLGVSAQVELNAVALRVDAEATISGPNASVIYFKDRMFRRAVAKTVIVAAHSGAARHLVEHLLDGERKAAWAQFNTVPVVVANVAIRTAAPLVDLGLGYSQAWWGSRYWANFSIADWLTGERANPDRPTVLTFFGGNRASPEELPEERRKLLQTPFSDYEKSLKEDLSRILSGSKFDFDRDVTAIFLYRWGHGMIMPTPNQLFGNVPGRNGRLDRSKAPRRVACSPLGPILFAGQHREGTPSMESAVNSGYRAANEALALL